MWRLDVNENRVRSLIEEGWLLWAFNIALNADGLRQWGRVLTQSVENFLAGPVGASEAESDWRTVASLIFPAKPAIVTCELARSLNCSREQARRLISAGQFQIVPGTRCRRGPGGAAQVVTASAVEWLRKRRLF